MEEEAKRFARAVETVLRHEGGYSNDPLDQGGETRFGISRRSYPSLDIKALTRAQAEEIYYRDWWARFGYGGIQSGAIAAKVLDLSVNIGPGAAHRLVQEAVNQTSGACLRTDGAIGPDTLAALNNHPCPDYLLAAIRLLAVRYYLGLGKPRFLAGWIRRAID